MRKSPTPRKSRAKKPKQDHYIFRLFVAGNGLNSQKALTNLHSLCEEHLKGRYTVETVDVVKKFQAAARDNILVTPTLLLVSPLPRVMVLGSLCDREKVLIALRILENNT